MISHRVKAIIKNWGTPSPLPPPVRACLADAPITSRLTALIRRLSGYQNLTMDQRRQRAIALARTVVEEEGRHLGSHDLSILVALVYARVKEETPFLIAPEPNRW